MGLEKSLDMVKSYISNKSGVMWDTGTGSDFWVSTCLLNSRLFLPYSFSWLQRQIKTPVNSSSCIGMALKVSHRCDWKTWQTEPAVALPCKAFTWTLCVTHAFSWIVTYIAFKTEFKPLLRPLWSLHIFSGCCSPLSQCSVCWCS